MAALLARPPGGRLARRVRAVQDHVASSTAPPIGPNGWATKSKRAQKVMKRDAQIHSGLRSHRWRPPKEQEIIQVDGHDVTISNPQKCCSHKPASPSAISCSTTSPLPTARCAAPAAGRTCSSGYPNGDRARSSSTRSARPASRPTWIEVVTLSFPSGRTADEIVPRDAAALAWMANLACLELHPHPVRADDLDHPDELRVDLDPVPGVDVVADPRRRRASFTRRSTNSASSAGRRRPDRAVSTCTCASSGGGAFTEVRRAAARARARGRTARAGARDEQVVEGRAPRRVSRLQPERQGPDGRRRRTRCGRRRTRASRRRWPGRSSTRATRRTSRCKTMPDAVRGAWAICTRASTTTSCSLEVLLELVGEAGARGTGRRAVAAALQEAAGRGAAGRSRRVARPAPIRPRRTPAPSS